MGYSEIGEVSGVRWDDFRLFLAVTKFTSIKKAAASLGMTQSALSKRVSRLEAALGVKLFDRSAAGTALTYQGERVLVHAKSAADELSKANNQAHAANDRIEGDCSVLLPDGIGNFWLSNFMEPFLSLHPNIELRVFLDHDVGAARNNAFDIRLHYYELGDPTQVMRPLATAHFMPFAAKPYIAAHGLPERGDLHRHRFVDQTQHLTRTGNWSSWFDTDVIQRTVLFTNQSAFVVPTVRAGVGIGLMPTYLSLFYDELVPIELGVHLSSELYASYHHERVKKVAVKTTLDYIRSRIFDGRRMPWFAKEYRPYEPAWRDAYEQALARGRPESTRSSQG